MLPAESEVGRSAVTVILNGVRTVLDAAPGERLLDVLRRAGALDVKEGCGEGECGSCSVLLDGQVVCSCLTLAQSAEGAEVTTAAVKGNVIVDNLRSAFVEEMGTQCGFCTPGMVLAAADLLAQNPRPSFEQVQVGLEGNLCRCTGYTRVVRAVQLAADKLVEEAQS